MLAIQDERVISVDGMIDKDAYKSIHNLTSIGKYVMDETDSMSLTSW